MIVDFSEAGEAVLAGRTFDLCVVGTGPAGITLATNLSRQFSVLLLEGGGFEPSEESQRVYEGGTIGHGYYDLAAARVRCFGGTSTHWAGMCQALQDYDFEARSHVAHSGWPIGRSDLDPYFTRAAEILDIDLAERKVPGYRARFDRALGPEEFVRPFQFIWSPPTRFGSKFRSSIAASPNITCLLNANLTDILLNESGTAATHVEVTGYERGRAIVPARRVVVAAGGIENARLLLNCNRQIKAGLGNDHDLVGRFFMEHPDFVGGWLVLEDDLREAVLDQVTGDEMDNFQNAHFYSVEPAFAQEHEVLNFALAGVIRPTPRDRPLSFKQRLRQAICEPDWLSEGLDFVFRDGMPICRDGFFRIFTEQAPSPDSRVSLSTEKDRFGWRRTNLDWRMLPIDGRTAAVAATQFASRFATHDLGRVRVREWILADRPTMPEFSQWDGASYHHMGTTRMSADPRQGVVDRDCRVHGMSNLYMAGSSVFATSGFVNPTFTIVQLSLRLANHLNSA